MKPVLLVTFSLLSFVLLAHTEAFAADSRAGLMCRRHDGQILSLQPGPDHQYIFQLGDEKYIQSHSLQALREAYPMSSDQLLRRLEAKPIGQCSSMTECELFEVPSPLIALCRKSENGTEIELRIELQDHQYLATCSTKTDLSADIGVVKMRKTDSSKIQFDRQLFSPENCSLESSEALIY